MNKEHLIQLTNALYRLTLFFPRKEPLRYKMRELADEILANFANVKNATIVAKMEILDCFFEVAKNQNWVSPNEILKIQEDYSKLKEELKKENPEEKKENPLKENSMLERQEKILEFLKENGRAQVWQLKQIFPEVTKRTLRRDFEHLLAEGTIERTGERNDTFYTRARQSRTKGGEEDLSSSTQVKRGEA